MHDFGIESYYVGVNNENLAHAWNFVKLSKITREFIFGSVDCQATTYTKDKEVNKFNILSPVNKVNYEILQFFSRRRQSIYIMILILLMFLISLEKKVK